jgi:hypothetical protein
VMLVRYMERDGIGYLVRKAWESMNLGYCLGSGAKPVRPIAPRSRVACPECGRVCAIAPRGTVWAHYSQDRIAAGW